MNNWIVVLFAGFALSVCEIEAHEGHGIPGALPPALHGGVVQEAEHTGKDLHHGASKEEEVELFIEVVYKNKELEIYPLTLDPKKPNAFVSLSPTKDLSKIVLTTEIPRPKPGQKKKETLAAKVEAEMVRAAFDSMGVNRFFVHVSTEFRKEVKLAKVQIEAK